MPMRITGFSPIVRKEIRDRCDDICERCGSGIVWQLHHRRPRGAGGTRRPESNQAANGLGLCNACHASVESNRAEALKLGFLVPQSRNPSEVPVLRRGLWVLLDNAGDYIAIPEPAGGRVA